MYQAIESRQDAGFPPGYWGGQIFDHALADPGPGQWPAPGGDALRVWLRRPRRLMQLIGQPGLALGDDERLAAPDVDAWLATHFGERSDALPGL
jgi:hypothetical protein